MAIGCVICTEEFHSNTEKFPVILKNCGHVFHNECLKKWLAKSKTCPICRNMTVDSPSFVGRVHLQRLSIDNPTINSLLDETEELKVKLEEKKREIKIKDERLKKKDDELMMAEKKMNDMQLVITNFRAEIKSMQDVLDRIKRINSPEPNVLLNAKCDPRPVEVASSSSDPSRRPISIRTIRVSSAAGSTIVSSSRPITVAARALNMTRISAPTRAVRPISASNISIARRH